MPRRGAPPLPPAAYPRFAGLDDVLRLFSGDRCTHGIPPGTHWLWLTFPESWPLVSPDQGNYTGPATDAMMPGLKTALSTWVTASGSMLSTAVGLSWLKFNEINALGHYVSPSNSRLAEVNPVVHGTGNPIHPPQVAIAVSLRTAHTRGKAHIGRMFTPALVPSVQSSGLHAAGTSIAGTATTLINAINAVVTPAGVSIISATGESNHVTRVAVGRIFDTMRSRRRSLSESPYELGAVLA